MTSGLVDQETTHPLVRLVDLLEHEIDAAGSGPAWTLSPRQLAELLPRWARLQKQVDARVLQMLREADRHQVGDSTGAASTAAWWANTTRTTKKDAHRQVALAAALDEDAHAPTAAALDRGDVSTDQAAVILGAVEALPPSSSRRRSDATSSSTSSGSRSTTTRASCGSWASARSTSSPPRSPRRPCDASSRPRSATRLRLPSSP